MSCDDTVSIRQVASPNAPSIDLPVPRQLAGVRLLREIGRGGMGTVWLGRHEMLGRDVAVKFLLNAAPDGDDPAFGRFLEEARAAAAVRHPGLTAIHHADVIEKIPFIVMQYVDGPTLSEVLRRAAPLSVAATLTVVDAVSAVIAELHERGIIHRDIKPSNILLDRDGHVFVTDFGLAVARAALGDSRSTQRWAGTPAYMSPEMFAGAVSPRSDVYALGILTFELLTGGLPFTGTLEEIREKHAHEPLPVTRLEQRNVSSGLVDVLERATHKNPMFRYRTAEHFRKALQNVVATNPGAAELSQGGRELQELISRSLDERPRAVTAEATTATPSTSYFDRLSEIADGKRNAEQEHSLMAARPAELPAHRAISTPADTLMADVPCVNCAYNLRGLSASGLCPECGTRILPSLRPGRLIFAPPKWLSRIALGQALIWSTIIAIPFYSFFELLLIELLKSKITLFPYMLAIGGIVAAATAGIAAGVFLSTTREPVHPARNGTLAIRWTARISGVVPIPSFIGVAKSALDEGRSQAVGLFCAFAGLACSLLGLLCFLSYLKTLADRIPNVPLATRTRYVALALGALSILGGVSAAFAFGLERVFPMFSWLMLVVLSICITFWCLTLVLSWGLMRLYRKAVKSVIAQAVLYDTLYANGS